MHTPVLLNEILKYLNPRLGDVFIDATINGGGHAQAIAKCINKHGRLLGIDRDCELLHSESLSYKLQATSYKLVCDTFANIQHIAKQHAFANINGILFDLGFSSYQLDESGRGFSFQKDEPLDMRYDTSSGVSAEELLATRSEEELIYIFQEYGEERFSKTIARAIVQTRKRLSIRTTKELVYVVVRAIPARFRKNKIHAATRVFQALRICVNDEYSHISKGISDGAALLGPDGRIAVIAFHSGEDRLVKTIFRDLETEGILQRITKKPISPSQKEIHDNPRARSAKLRVGERL